LFKFDSLLLLSNLQPDASLSTIFLYKIKTWIFFPLHSVISYLQFTTQREVYLVREMSSADCFYQISYYKTFILSVICVIWISSLYSICQWLYYLIFSWFNVPLYEPSVKFDMTSLDDLMQLLPIEVDCTPLSTRFGALISDSTHHFFRNACTKSGSLRFSQFSGCWLILSVYILMSFDFPFVRLLGVR
jgi:hypothetical protein